MIKNHAIESRLYIRLPGVYNNGWSHKKKLLVFLVRDMESLPEPGADGGIKAKFESNSVQGLPEPQHVLSTQ